nr:PREDICTED: uncharacterized protein LOC106707024 [Latimeria chalumnae]|eukprot:XP_014354251.1 PREDICTED: uncharacterized protein LOC106707024 [Latimeria chalumnae]
MRRRHFLDTAEDVYMPGGGGRDVDLTFAAMFAAVWRTLGSRAALALRPVGFIQRAGVHGKPPKDPIGAVESFIGFSAISIALLGPAAWFFAHLQDYKKRS